MGGDKTDEFRDLLAKTDQDRLQFLRIQLEASFTLAGLAETEFRTHNPENAERSLDHAESGYSTLQRFLADPKHAEHIGDEELLDLKEGLAELREKLDDFAGYGKEPKHQDR